MAFFLKAIGFSDSVPGFPYTPSSGTTGDTIVTTPTLTWTLRSGVSSEDGRAVTIFSISLAKADSAVRDLAQNAMKKAKSLLLPGVLRCYGAVEHQGVVYMAMEPCEPLTNVLLRSSDTQTDEESEDAEEFFVESAALGLKAVGTALTTLHSNNIVHGNVSCDSVYVLPSGEWRLFGLELASSFGDMDSIYRHYAPLLPEYRRPPEALQMNCETGVHVSSTDSWGMACLIYEVLGLPRGQSRSNLAGAHKVSDMRGCRCLPRTLQSGFMGLCVVNHKMRHSVVRFLANSEFIAGSEFVKCMQALDEFSLKDSVERENFFEHITNVVDTFSKKACQRLVLSKIYATFNFGIFSSVIDPIMKIAARIKTTEEYATYVVPLIISLFSSQDRMVRYRLLQRASEYASMLPKDVVNEKVWPLFVSGFGSTVPSIREYSVRALVPLAGLLNENTIRNDVCRYITQLQRDNEGVIRANATISLCFIADVIPDEIRSKTLAYGFSRMLKDPFVPSRLGALRSLHTTLKYLTPQHIAEIVLPGMGPLAIDTVSEVRHVALDALRGVLERLGEYDTEELSAVEEKQGVGVGVAAHAAAVRDAAPDVNKKGLGLLKWGWGWSSASAEVATPSPAATDAAARPPDVTASNRVSSSSSGAAIGGIVNAHESLSAATASKTLATPATGLLANGSCMGNVKKETTNNGALSSASGASVDVFADRHVDSSKVKEPVAENRAMKLRKKGLGASRVA